MMRGVFITFLCFLGSFSFAWTPNSFEVYCGLPVRSVDLKEMAAEGTLAHPVSAYEAYLESSYQEFDTQFYYNKSFSNNFDPDITSSDNCLSGQRRVDVEQWASEILSALQELGFDAPTGQLGPVVKDEFGQWAVRLYIASGANAPGKAATLSPCFGGNYVGDTLSIMSFNAQLVGSTPPQQMYYILAHEMMHMVQNAQPFIKSSGDCSLVPAWLTEGTADAIALHLVEKRFGKTYDPPISTGIGKNFHGLRLYSKNFAWQSSADLPQYRVSSFFTYLADRYYGGNYNFIADFMKRTASGDDWFAWLDERLKTHVSGPKKDLYLVFPDFVANYANWGAHKFKHIKERDWLKETFNGCFTVELSPTQAASKELGVLLEPISAQCIKVRVSGVPQGALASVKVMVTETTTDKLDNLHLSAAYMTGKLKNVGHDFNCYRDLLGVRQASCLSKPFTGVKGTEFAKTWLSEPQESEGNVLESLFLLSHTPLNPSDSRHANETKQGVIVNIALDYTSLSSSTKGQSQKAKASAGMQDSGDLESIPMTGSESTGVFDANSLSQAFFNMNTAVPNLDDLQPFQDLQFLTIEEAELVSYGEGDSELEPGFGFMVFSEQPIPFGATGSYPAIVIGFLEGMNNMSNIGSILMNNGEAPSVTITVLEYSDALLHLKISGTYCALPNMDPQSNVCLSPDTLEAELFKPFGWVYSSEGFSSIDTPGMAVYRDDLLQRVSGQGLNLPSVPPAPASDAPSDPESPESADDSLLEQPACSCSCEEFEAFEALTEELESMPAEDLANGLPPEAEALMQCLTPCMMSYAQCVD